MTQFLAGTQWSSAAATPLAGDASSRRYLRLTNDLGNTAILMDAPPEACGSQATFVRLADHLRQIGLSAPQVFKADLQHGYLLLQDFGDRLFAAEARAGQETEKRLYKRAVDVLVHLNQPPPPDLPLADADHLTTLAEMAFTHYAPAAGLSLTETQTEPARAALHSVLAQALTGPRVMVLRDYHAENLILRPAETGLAQAGLLDFQDALQGHPAYDLVSLLQDARRDLAPGLEEAMITYYTERTGRDAAAFRLAYDTIAVQRHLRILGIFARLSLEFGKPHYIDYVPRTWAHLQRALSHPSLHGLATKLAPILPKPTPDVLLALRGDRP